MRQVAFLLGLASLAVATTTLSEPRKISGINIRTITADGQNAYVDNGRGMIYRLLRGEEGVRKIDSITYEGNRSEGALYIPHTGSTGYLVFRDSVCSVNWQWGKEDRMMCTGGVQLGWGGYTGGITMGKLNVCGGDHAYQFGTTADRPTLEDSLKYQPAGSWLTCQVRSADVIEVRASANGMSQIYRCLTVGECSDAPSIRSRPSDYATNRFTANDANNMVVDSMGRVGDWYSGPMSTAPGLTGFEPGPDRSAYLAAAYSTKVDNLPLAAVGFERTLVFGRRVDLGIEEYARIEFDQKVGRMDMAKDVLWMQVGTDIVSFDLKESIIASLGSVATDELRLRRIGRTLEFVSPANVPEIRIIGADGRLEARIPAGQGVQRWVAPTSGIRLVQMGSSSRLVLIP